jgi:hypothetical protein
MLQPVDEATDLNSLSPKPNDDVQRSNFSVLPEIHEEEGSEPSQLVIHEMG